MAIAARFERVLASAAANPGRRVHELDVLAEGERRQLLWEWNDTAREVPPDTVIDLFEAQAARTPDAVAVSGAGVELTYAQLDALASGFAAELAADDAGPERVVALVMGRSVQWVVAVLAVLKTGAAFLPLDPAHLAERIDRMLADAAPAIILGEDDVTWPGDVGLAAGPANGPFRAAGRRCGVPTGCRAGLAAGRRRGVRPLHLWFDRGAEGGGGQPRGAGDLYPAGTPHLPWSWAVDGAGFLAVVRLHLHGAVRCAERGPADPPHALGVR